MPSAILAVVVLPEPFGPIIVTISPGETLIETPRINHFPDLRKPTFSNDTNNFLTLKIFTTQRKNYL
jgi:hypothetical protein